MRYLSKEKITKLKEEYESLNTSLLKQNEGATKSGGPMDSFKEAASFSTALQALESKVAELKDALSDYQILPDYIEGDKIILGKWFVIKSNTGKRKYRLVDPLESSPIDGHISFESPLGKEAINKGVGEKFKINENLFEIISIV
jgi:transcription elongation GreA/GreB family factor